MKALAGPELHFLGGRCAQTMKAAPSLLLLALFSVLRAVSVSPTAIPKFWENTLTVNPKNDFETFPDLTAPKRGKRKHGRTVHHNWKSQAACTEIFGAYFPFWNFIFPWCLFEV